MRLDEGADADVLVLQLVQHVECNADHVHNAAARRGEGEGGEREGRRGERGR